MSEQVIEITPTPEQPVSSHRALPVASRFTIDTVFGAAASFRGGSAPFIGRTLNGEHRVIIDRETVGSGVDVEAAVADTLNGMRSLETIRTKSLATIKITPTSSVSFTALEHYSPRIAPSTEAYPVPDSLKALHSNEVEGGYQTYQNTTRHEGWQSELRGIVEGYITNTPAGRKLAESLKLQSLSHLTPEQAVKLSTAVIQSVSKYSYADIAKDRPAGPTRADNSTTMDLLREGIANVNKPDWQGNGVCRNFSANVAAVFESLKATQSELSMLRNTYAIMSRGSDGEGYMDARQNPHHISIKPEPGHAWTPFYTVDSSGSAVVTLVDSTWALGTDAESAIQAMDYTNERAALMISSLFEQSENKSEAFIGLTHYYQRLAQSTTVNSRLRPADKERVREFALTEYLKAASEVEDLSDTGSIPSVMMSTAYQMRQKLEKSEIEALYRIDTATDNTERERLSRIIQGYSQGDGVIFSPAHLADRLNFRDNDLQRLAFSAVGPERITQFADSNGRFRARLRDLDPSALPPFDARTNPADARELAELAEATNLNIRERDPNSIIRRVTQRIRRATDGNEALFNAVTVGRSEYDLVKHAGAIVRSLNGQK